MPKPVTQAQLETNENIVVQTLGSFGGDRYAPAAAIRAMSNNIVMTQMKPVLKQRVKGREEQFKRSLGIDPYRTEYAGSWPKYRFAIETALAHIPDVDGTSLEYLTTAALCILDGYMPNVFRTEGTKDLPDQGHSVPLDKAKPRYDFRKLIIEELKRMAKHGHIDFDEANGKVYRENVDSVLMMKKFWGSILHQTRSGFKRDILSTKASLDAPSRREIFGLVRDAHLGREYDLKPDDVETWIVLTGKEGAGFLFTDFQQRLHLQYEKPILSDVNLSDMASDALQVLNRTIRYCPFISTRQLKELHPQHYATAVEIWNRSPYLAPLIIADQVVSKELGRQLQWGQKEGLGMEHHNARQTLSQLWDQIRPKTPNEIEETSNVLITALYDLSQGKTTRTASPMEVRAMNALAPYVEQVAGRYQVKKGMDHSVDVLTLYVGA
jgi:hypothetical protein